MYINTIDGGVVANKRLQMIDSVQSTGGILMMTYDLARSLQEDLSSLRGKDFTWDYVILGKWCITTDNYQNLIIRLTNLDSVFRRST